MTKRIYIAGALNAPACHYLGNVSKMMEEAERVRKLGFAVLIPALDMLMGIKFGDWSYEDYFENNFAWLEVADAVYLCPGWELSAGCLKEKKRAEELGIPVITSIVSLLHLKEEKQ